MRLINASLAALLSLGVVSARAEEKSIIVLDASGSMWGQIDGKTKMDIARDTLGKVLTTIPATDELGLMVYGHRDKGSCSDIELAVPPAAGTAAKITSFIKGINPKGKTPIAASALQAAEALKYTEKKATVILVTDGIETCEADPCALATELKQKGIDFTAHVVGFGMTEAEGRQVACLADNTGGKYLQAKDASQLAEALRQTVAAAPPPKPVPQPAPAPVPAAPEFNVRTDAVLSEGGPSLANSDAVRWDIFRADSSGGKSDQYIDGGYDATYEVTIAPGKYVAEARLGNIIKTVPLEVTDGKISDLFVNFNAGEVRITPKRTPQDTAENAEARLDFQQNAFSDGGYGPHTYWLPAGEIRATGKFGPVEATETLTVRAGEKSERDLIVASGVAVATAIYTESGPAVESDNIRFDAISPTKTIDGSQKEFNGLYGVEKTMDLAPGDYLMRTRLGDTEVLTPFNIRAGERTDLKVNIGAGVLAIRAPGASYIEVFDAQKNLEGQQRSISGKYAEEHQETLKPGDYTVKVTYTGDKAPREQQATVKAGERAEITVE